MRGPGKSKGFLSRIEIGGFQFGRIDPRDGSEGVGIERKRSEASSLCSPSAMPAAEGGSDDEAEDILCLSAPGDEAMKDPPRGR